MRFENGGLGDALSDYNSAVNTKLVLGTANFGNAYGITASNPTDSVVGKEMAERILAKAVELSIAEIDTAINYVPAQEWISGFSRSAEFLISSKIPWHGLKNDLTYKTDLKFIKKTFEGLNLKNILWHNWDGPAGHISSYSELHQRLDPGSRFGFGVTTYGPSNADGAIQTRVFNSVQIEFNVLNHSALSAFQNYGSRIKPNLYLRSIFLQGALSQEGSQLLKNKPGLMMMVTKARTLATEWQMSLEEMALRAVTNWVSNCSIVVGVNSDLQLEQLQAYLVKGPLPSELFNKVIKLESSHNPEIDPRNWKQ